MVPEAAVPALRRRDTPDKVVELLLSSLVHRAHTGTKELDGKDLEQEDHSRVGSSGFGSAMNYGWSTLGETIHPSRWLRH